MGSAASQRHTPARQLRPAGQAVLWNELTGVGIRSGTQLPKRGESLSPDELELVRSWICHGAADD